MQLDKQQAEELRARLANRTSFFGGSMSTRNASASRSYTPPADLPPVQHKPAKAAPTGKTAGKPITGAPERPAQAPKNTEKEIAEKLRRTRASFDDLDKPRIPQEAKRDAPASTSGRPSAMPTGAPSRHAAAGRADLMAKVLAQRAGSAPPQGASSRDRMTPPPRTLTPPPLGGFGRNTPGPSSRQASPAGALSRPYQQMRAPVGLQKAKTGKAQPAPRMKKGAACRADAFSPQAVAPTRSQKANQAWKDQMARFRNDAAPSTSAAASSAASSATAHPSSQPSSGRPFASRPASQGPGTAAALGAQRGVRQGDGSVGRVQGTSRGISEIEQALWAKPRGQPPAAPIDLRGKDLSGLPKWQQDLLRKKWADAQRRQREEEDSEADDDDGFVVNDEEEDWRAAIRQVTGYDPSRFRDERFDDKSMEADWKSIQAEERRSARLGRSEDEKAEQEELARQAVKAARKKAKRGSQGFVMD